MNGRRFGWTLWVAIGLWTAAPMAAQTCDDGSFCTINDMCTTGTCTGTPVGGSCDDFNPCTVNDTCVSGTCQGSPASPGTACNDGCGMCAAGQCILNFAANGNPCNDDFICTTNDRCQFGICFGDFKFCPDTDGNACTLDFCNPLNGTCVATDFPPCGDCQSCTDVDGDPVCATAGNGNTCDDFNSCTGDGACDEGDCLDGPPVSPGQSTATPTRTASPSQGGPTRTATPTVPPPPLAKETDFEKLTVPAVTFPLAT